MREKAVVAIVLGFIRKPEIAVFGVLIVVGLMFVIVIFTRYAGTPMDRKGLSPADVLVWFYTVAIMAATVLLMWNYFRPEHGSEIPGPQQPQQQAVSPTSCREFSVYEEYGTQNAFSTNSIQYFDWDGQRQVAKYSPTLDIKYKEWGGTNFEARIDGTNFLHAPDGNFKRAHPDYVIRYVDWDQKKMTGTIVPCQ